MASFQSHLSPVAHLWCTAPCYWCPPACQVGCWWLSSTTSHSWSVNAVLLLFDCLSSSIFLQRTSFITWSGGPERSNDLKWDLLVFLSIEATYLLICGDLLHRGPSLNLFNMMLHGSLGYMVLGSPSHRLWLDDNFWRPSILLLL